MSFKDDENQDLVKRLIAETQGLNPGFVAADIRGTLTGYIILWTPDSWWCTPFPLPELILVMRCPSFECTPSVDP